MVYKIVLTPTEPYFLGNERCAAYGTTTTQRSLSNPYFLQSSQMPSQSALFGVLRYLGIRNPDSTYALKKEDKEYIGAGSFQLIGGQADNVFGKIKRISSLMIQDKDGNIYVAAPRNHKAVCFSDEKNQTEDFQAYQQFTAVAALDQREVLIPKEYSAKAWDQGEFLCLNTGKLIGNLFSTQIRVGINRAIESDGFFKKEYVILKPGYSFIYYAELEDDACGNKYGFTEKGTRMVSLGQGKAAFSASWEKTEEQPSWDELKNCFPEEITVNGELRKVYYAYAKSDIFFDGDLQELRKHCALALAEPRDYRVFTTNYNAKTAKDRYLKHPKGLKLMKAGSVFLFNSKEQQNTFKRLLEKTESFQHGCIAGFNQIYYSEE